MQIIIIGAGKVGNTLATQLVKEGHDVTVIDINGEVLNDLSNTIDIMTITGNGASQKVLEEANVKDSDLVLAVSSADESNILACFVAHEMGAPKTIARVRNPEYGNQLEMIKDTLGLSMTVNPEKSAAAEISRILRFPSANEVETFCKGKVELVEHSITEDSPLVGLSLIEVSKKFKIKILVCAVRRGEEVFIPKGDFVIENGDRIYITSTPKDIADFFKAIGSFKSPVKNVIIVGGSMIAIYTAMQLLELGIRVKIIEQNKERCEELSEILPKASIVCADATEKDLLIEEGILDTDAFVALTGLDEANIIYSMYARAKNVKKVITKVHHLTFPEVIENSGIESVISPKTITAEQISSYVRSIQNSFSKTKVESLRLLLDGKVEALEFKANSNELYIGVPLKYLEVKQNILIAALVRNGKTIIPSGDDSIQRGDSVIVVSANMIIDDLKDIIR